MTNHLRSVLNLACDLPPEGRIETAAWLLRSLDAEDRGRALAMADEIEPSRFMARRLAHTDKLADRREAMGGR